MLLVVAEMPPKRVRKKSKDHEVKATKSDKGDHDELAHFTDDEFVQGILSHPALKIKEVRKSVLECSTFLWHCPLQWPTKLKNLLI